MGGSLTSLQVSHSAIYFLSGGMRSKLTVLSCLLLGTVISLYMHTKETAIANKYVVKIRDLLVSVD